MIDMTKINFMRLRKWVVFSWAVLICFMLGPIFTQAENKPIKKANYILPARFGPSKLKKMVFSTKVDAHWLKHSNRFWYTFETSKGKNWYLVDPGRKIKANLFNNVKMAAMLTKITKDPYDALHLPIKTITFIKNDKVIYFKIKKSSDVLAAEKHKEKIKRKKLKRKNGNIEKEDGKKKKGDEKEEKNPLEKAKKEAEKYHHFEYRLSDGKLTLLTDYFPKIKPPKWASISPDGKTVIFGRHHNLFYMTETDYEKSLKDLKDKSIIEQQLTKDGEEYYSYQSGSRGETNVDKEKKKDKRKPVRILWSQDSKKFAMIRNDSRKVKDLWAINSVAKDRPTLETYKYHMPGEAEAPQYELLIFDIEKKTRTKVKADMFKDQSIRIMSARYPVNTRDDLYRPRLWLSKTPDKLYFSRTSRDLKRIDICYADSESGDVKVLIEERLNTYIETRRMGFINNGKELIHWSERDGWAHFYLYDGNGKLKRQLTSGPWHCHDILNIDEKARVMFFTANHREKGEDPYYRHIYRINLDGSGLKLLNKGNFNHDSRVDDSSSFFVDNYSRVNTIPKSVLKDLGGNKLMDLEKADLSLLFKAGYKFPEPFKAKADDGVTDIYGVMYKPFNFQPTEKYPIIAYVYPGPQTEAVAKSFSSRMDRTDRLAQFGFIVVTMGNRGGHPSRSKWYHNYGYGNLRDYGLADKKAVIEQLAFDHTYINIDKVGIFGHSGGGFMSTAAMLVYPDFFKVAVSSAGNHENNIYNRWWSEKHHGVREVVDEKGKISFEYDIEKNSEIAKNLKGRLLICTGDIDNNVHPANTIRLAEALVKANKRFDFFIFPGQRHGFGKMNEYFFWLRADYFCKHLIGDYADSVDIKEINIEKEMNNGKKGGE